jgi:BMFP domain-containing protein YqiC|tara:strand:- start:838 stop:1065 length:228 start_codon:yes stop_codon:yes gene_type:complete
MNNSEKLLKLLSSFVENGILSSQDVKKELLTNLNFKKDKIVNKLDLVSRKEFEVLKQIVLKQEKELKNFKKKRTK